MLYTVWVSVVWCVHIENIVSFSFGSLVIKYLRRKGYVSDGGLIFKFCSVFWSVWFIWYCLGSYWSLLMLPEWAKQIFPDQQECLLVGRACVAIILSAPHSCFHIPRWEKNVSACGNKQDSKTRTLAVTALLFLIPPVSLCRGEEFQAC